MKLICDIAWFVFIRQRNDLPYLYVKVGMGGIMSMKHATGIKISFLLKSPTE